jgi:hypothetical protein
MLVKPLRNVPVREGGLREMAGNRQGQVNIAPDYRKPGDLVSRLTESSLKTGAVSAFEPYARQQAPMKSFTFREGAEFATFET